MLLFTYLRRELRHRLRQSILIAVGLAVGIGLVLTVAATAAGVRDAEARVLASLDTLGTDISVTKTPSAGMSTNSGGGLSIGPQDAGKQIDLLQDADPGSFGPSVLAQLRTVDGVAAVTGELALIDTKMTVPKPGAASLPLPTTILVDGVDPAHSDIGTLGQASLASGRGFKAADAQSDVALLDTAYATTNKLKVGSTITLAKKAFKVIGLVHQKADASERVFIPLARAQALSGSKDKLTTAYVAAKSSGEVDAVAKAISKKLSWANVTTSSSLADQISGSLEDTSKLADNLGRWIAIATLAAAFGLAVLLTLSAVSRRVREFGTLKAVGWRTRRIVGQVFTESLAIGLIGAILGIGLGYGGAALVSRLTPTLTAVLPATASGPEVSGPTTFSGGSGGPVQQTASAPANQTMAVHFGATVALHILLLALLLGIAGGVLAGAFGGWRAGRLRPAAALAKVA